MTSPRPTTANGNELLDLFTRYNQDWWPAHVVAYAVGVACVALLFTRRRAASDRAIAGLLAALWAWLALVFQAMYATDVSLAAGSVYAVLFGTQAVLLLRLGVQRSALRFTTHNGVGGRVGWAAIGFAVVVYPVLGVALGHGWPRSPLLGMAPCPTTILTFGLLLLAQPPIPHRLLVAPLIWALLAPPAAMSQGAYEDAGLLIFGVLATTLIIVRDRPMHRPASPAHPATASGSALRQQTSMPRTAAPAHAKEVG